MHFADARAVRLPLKELLIGLYLLSGYGPIAERIASLQLSLSLLLYVGLFALFTLCLALAAYVENSLLRLLYAFILFSSALFLDAYERATGSHLTYDAFVNMVNSRGFAEEALHQHSSSIMSATVAAFFLFMGVAIRPTYVPPLPRFAAAMGPIIGVSLLSALLFARGGDGARGLPTAMAPLAYLSLSGYEWAAGQTGPRQSVNLARQPGKIHRDIILIIDESVGANYLDLNARHGVSTGLNQPRPGVNIYNYGYAAAITNCSVGTNVTLRYGGTRSDYMKINSTMPSIWQYARAAGLKTVYVDAQRTGGNLHNLMTKDELKEIDHLVQFDTVPVRYRDLAAADKLAELVNNQRAEFILVNKVGAHFPVHDKYPDELMLYRPALPRGRWANVSDTGDRSGFRGAADDWMLYRNSYKNTLLWNVAGFFDRLLDRADLSNATLIYTSDHGQNLHERGSPGVTTHCNGDPEIEEGLVPLVVLARADSIPDEWEPARPAAPAWWNAARVTEVEPPPLAPTVTTTRSRGAAPTLFDEEPARPPGEPAWIKALLGSEVYASQRAGAGRQALDDDRASALLVALHRRGGTALLDTLAADAGIPSLRIRGTITSLRRVLNVDGYDVVGLADDGTVSLNRSLLAVQFGVEMTT